MRINDIQIDGFGIWKGLTVDTLDPGLTLFYGHNEAGKTTVVEAGEQTRPKALIGEAENPPPSRSRQTRLPVFAFRQLATPLSATMNRFSPQRNRRCHGHACPVADQDVRSKNTFTPTAWRKSVQGGG